MFGSWFTEITIWHLLSIQVHYTFAEEEGAAGWRGPFTPLMVGKKVYIDRYDINVAFWFIWCIHLQPKCKYISAKPQTFFDAEASHLLRMTFLCLSHHNAVVRFRQKPLGQGWEKHLFWWPWSLRWSKFLWKITVLITTKTAGNVCRSCFWLITTAGNSRSPVHTLSRRPHVNLGYICSLQEC